MTTRLLTRSGIDQEMASTDDDNNDDDDDDNDNANAVVNQEEYSTVTVQSQYSFYAVVKILGT